MAVLIFFCLSTASAFAQTLTINVTTQGTLSSQVGSQKNSITSLKVTGNLNGADILCIREMAGSDINGSSTNGKLTTLDLAGANIVSSSGASNYYYKTNTTSNNTIGSYMFYNCTGLTLITSNATTPPTLQSNTFTNVPKNIPVYVPCGCLSTYKANQYWNTFTNMTDDCTDITNISTEVFKIFPNPVQSELFIKSDIQVNKVEIYSLTGILLLSENNFNEKISVVTLPKEIYVLRVYTENGVMIERIIKE